MKRINPFSFRGRIGRLPFAAFMLIGWGIAYSVKLRVLVDASIHVVDPDYPSNRIPLAGEGPHFTESHALAVLILMGIFVVALTWASLSLLAKRLHDVDLSAWLVVPSVLLVYLVPNVYDTTYFPPLGAVILIAILALMPGTSGTNRFDNAEPAKTLAATF